MSVIVKGIDVPSDCDGCWHPTCNLWHQTDVGERHRGCPLRPLPKEHGRLVDASKMDAVIYSLKDHGDETFDDGVVFALEMLDSLPTVIEAEGD